MTNPTISQAHSDTKKCSTCHKVKLITEFYRDRGRKDGFEYYCKECRVNRSRVQNHRKLWNKNHSDRMNIALKKYLKRNPEKIRCWREYRMALKQGKLIRKDCEVCGKESQGHHPDYSKPLEVIWLCRRHHKDIHAGRLNL